MEVNQASSLLQILRNIECRLQEIAEALREQAHIAEAQAEIAPFLLQVEEERVK